MDPLKTEPCSAEGSQTSSSGDHEFIFMHDYEHFIRNTFNMEEDDTKNNIDVIKMELNSDEEKNPTSLLHGRSQTDVGQEKCSVVKSEDKEELVEQSTVEKNTKDDITLKETGKTTERPNFVTSSSISGRPLRSQARNIVYNVAKYLKEKKTEFKLKYNVVEATSAATGVSQSLVNMILKERIKSLSPGEQPTFPCPNEKPKERKKKAQTREFMEGEIRKTIHEIYTTKKTVPTVEELIVALKRSGNFNSSRTHLRNVIWCLGFRWRKCPSRGEIIIEKPNIATWRARYLRAIRGYRLENRNIVFLDETYLHVSHTGKACWQSPTEKGVTKSIVKGPRLIIAHAGGESGFVKDALLIFKSKQKTGDYHDDMNASNFMKWMEKQVLPNLPSNSVIVMDNAPYHSAQVNRRPSSTTLKKDIIRWLKKNKISYDENMRKPDLLDLVKKVPEEKSYVIDQVLKERGHDVLRLPVKQADLNPIKLVWADIKGEVAKDLSGDLDTKKVLFEQLIAKYSAEKWKEYCEHVKKIEEQYWVSDAIMIQTADSIMTPGDDQDSSNSASETTTDSDSESD